MDGLQTKKLAAMSIQFSKVWICSNQNNGESNLPEDIKNWIFPSSTDLLSVEEGFSPPKRRVWIMRESFICKKTFVNIFGFLRESQCLINKTSTVQCVVDSIKFTHQKKGFIASFKICRILSSLEWLKQLFGLITFTLSALNMLFAIGLIKPSSIF